MLTNMTPRNKKEGWENSSSMSERDDQSSSAADEASCDTSSQGPSGGNSTGNNSLEIFGFTKYSIAAISCSRWIFLGALLFAASGLAAAVFLTLNNEQQRDFEVEFEGLAFEINDAAKERVKSVFQIMNGVTTMMTSFIDIQNSTNYPKGFITIPHLEQHLGTARNASDALVLAYVPLVQASDLQLWNEYSKKNKGWVADHYTVGHNNTEVVTPILTTIWDYAAQDNNSYSYENHCIDGYMHEEDRVPVTTKRGPFAPLWTFSPGPKPSDSSIINHDLFSRKEFEQAIQSVNSTRQPMFLDVCNMARWFNVEIQRDYVEALIAFPVLDGFSDTSEIVGYMILIMPWSTFFQVSLPEATKSCHVVLESSCGQVATYEIRDQNVVLLGRKDVHNREFHSQGVLAVFADFANTSDMVDSGLDRVCEYTTTVYPTTEFHETFQNQKPIWYALIVLGIYMLTSVLFCLFDVLMTRQRNRVMEAAEKQHAIVSSLFPKNIQAKLMQQADTDNTRLSKIGKAGLKNYLFDSITDGDQGNMEVVSQEANTGGHRRLDKSKPIADLFPETTIMFGDIAGFTAWSSAREPTQVFTLLETIYHEFDRIAKRRRVFKVEVVGDCYVAVCGLPDPRVDHAIVMSKFAMECVREMNRLTQELEVELGPDTTELCLRVGLHSGPVVAGVLRGEKSRFQLFGDTMNTASRMESTGVPNMVHISQETADLLIEANKKHWFEPRQEKIEAKGKGELNTFFLKMNQGTEMARSVSGYSSSDENSSVGTNLHTFRDDGEICEKRNRIAEWTVEVLAGLLKDIEIRRKAAHTKSDSKVHLRKLENSTSFHENGDTVISEVKEIIELPKFDAVAAKREAKIDVSEVSLSDEVFQELRDFVQTIASMYHENPFHNFPHANHVTMSVVKLLSRIVAPDVENMTGTLHDHTYGITSDPLTRFAVVLSALIHDVDHMGVPNIQLVKENDPVAQVYCNKSVAEQNSIDLAWELLMESRFDNLRRQIYTTEPEFKRFRQLVVNSVLATDIMDKDLKDLRNKRWSDAFEIEQSGQEAVNRKATIVIEHLIQASDVAHTMQHWHIYRKWNERLFQEMYKAWEDGRMDQDPSLTWYKGEIGFFDFYVIPLAKKLKECGVFGVSSDEYLSYALQNRKEWASRGEELVGEMVRAIKRKHVAASVYAAAKASVDHEGNVIIADMSQNLRKPSTVTVGHDASETFRTIDTHSNDESDDDGDYFEEDEDMEYGLVLK